MHCGVLTVGIRRKLGLPSRFDMRFSNPLDLHAIALAHPRLPIIVPHFGAGMFREALMLADLCPNVVLDTSSSNHWIDYHPGLTLADVFRQALLVAGPSRLLFGTDSSFFPRGWNRAVWDAQYQALEAPERSRARHRRDHGEQFRADLSGLDQSSQELRRPRGPIQFVSFTGGQKTRRSHWSLKDLTSLISCSRILNF